MTPRERQLSGLKPIKPGEVRNPKGINQYSGKQAFLARLEEKLREKGADGRTLADRLADQLLQHTEGHIGDAWEKRQARDLVYSRMLPDVRVGIDAQVDGQITVTTEDKERARERLLKLAGKSSA